MSSANASRSIGEFAGAACACCGVWIRVRPVYYRGGVYGQKCGAGVKHAVHMLRRGGDIAALHLAGMEQTKAGRGHVAHARELVSK